MKGFSQVDGCDKEPPDWRSLSLRVSCRSSPKKERKREDWESAFEHHERKTQENLLWLWETLSEFFFSFSFIIGSTSKLLMRFHSLLVGVDTGWNSQVWFWTDTQQEAEFKISRGPTNSQLAHLHRKLAHFHRGLAQVDRKLAQLYRKLAQLHRKLAQLYRKLAELHRKLAPLLWSRQVDLQCDHSSEVRRWHSCRLLS